MNMLGTYFGDIRTPISGVSGQHFETLSVK